MAEKQFYFVDTREDAKSTEPFAITNADVAKSWTREYNNGDGPFKPVSEEEYQKNRYDLAEELEDGEALNVQTEANQTDRNLELIGADHMAVADVTTVEEADGDTISTMSENTAERATGGNYDNMDKDELRDELDARGISYKKSGPESTNEFYIRLLEEDDAKNE